jgi:ABC-type sugar transport system ATPase subunit
VVGSGLSSLLESIWGARAEAEGGLTFCGKPLPPAGIAARMAAGVAFVPEDRRTAGLVMHHAVLDNTALPRLARYRAAARLPFFSWRKAAAGARVLLSAHKVKYGRLSDRISTLSGGNQQKAMIGRWFADDVELLLLDEPTRGVDVRSKADIHALCRRLGRSGTAVLFVTSDIEELLMLAGRILVMAGGRITLDVVNRGVTRQQVVDASFRLADDATAVQEV